MSKKIIIPLAAIAFLALIGTGVWYLQVSQSVNSSGQTMVNSALVNTVSVQNYSVTLAYQQGDVWVSQNEGDWHKGETDFVLHEGDGVKTGENSKAILEFEDGDIVRMDASTEISLVYTNGIAVTILQTTGTTYNRVAKDQSRIYQVVSSLGSAQALGTAFGVEVTDDNMNVNVVESTVKVKSSDAEAQVTQGKSAKLTKDASSLVVSDIAGDKLSSDWYTWNKEEDTKKQLALGVLDQNPDSTGTNSSADEKFSPKITLAVSTVANGLSFTWESENMTSTDGFKVVRGDGENPTFPGNDYQYIQDSHATNYTWEMKDWKTYHFRVCAYDGSICTLYSNDVIATAPSDTTTKDTNQDEAPTYKGPNLSAKAEESGVGLWWQDTSSLPGFKYYKVVRSEDNADLKYPDDGYLTVRNKGEESWRDKTSVKGTAYYYRICAVGDEVWCGQVQKVTATTKNDPPKAVSLSATYANKKVTLTWTRSTESDFKYYKIVWSNSDTTPTYPENGYIVWEPLTTLTYTDAGQVADGRKTEVDLSVGTYYYSVCVVDQADQVACSNVVKIENGTIK